jgi:hypothetical protein
MRDGVWNLDVYGVGLLRMDRDLVRDFHRVRHRLLDRVRDLLDEYRVRLLHFHGARTSRPVVHRGRLWVRNLPFHGHKARLLHGHLQILVWTVEAGLRVVPGLAVALVSGERSEER